MKNKGGRPKKITAAKPDEDKKNILAPRTPEEQAIRLRSDADSDKSWESVGEDSVLDFELNADPLALPAPAQKEYDEKRYAFRWAEMKTQNIDKLRTLPVPFKWAVCNAVNTPFLEDFIDPVLGCVINLGQLLMYKPWWMHMKVADYELKRAEAHHGSVPLEALDGESKDKGGEFVSYIGNEDDKDKKGARAKIGGSDLTFHTDRTEGIEPSDSGVSLEVTE
jgi:hypothetical protein